MVRIPSHSNAKQCYTTRFTTVLVISNGHQQQQEKVSSRLKPSRSRRYNVEEKEGDDGTNMERNKHKQRRDKNATTTKKAPPRDDEENATGKPCSRGTKVHNRRDDNKNQGLKKLEELELFHLNAQGLTKQSKNKLHYIAESISETTVVLINETHYSDKITTKEIEKHFPKHNVVRSDRDIKRGVKKSHGGAMILVPKILAIQTQLCYSNGQVEVAAAFADTENCFGTVYAPPDSPAERFIEVLDKLEQFINKVDPESVTITGDWNLASDIVTYSKPSDEDYLVPIYRKTNSHQSEMHKKVSKAKSPYEFANKLILNQIVTEPTRGDSYLDLVFTNIDTTNVVVEEINDISDHKQITCKMHLPLPVVQQQRKDKRPLIQRLSHQNTDKEKAVKMLEEVDWEERLQHLDPNKQKQEMISTLTEILIAAGAEEPKMQRNRISKDIVRLRRKKERIAKKLKYMPITFKTVTRRKKIQEINLQIAQMQGEYILQQEKQAIKSSFSTQYT